MRLEDMMLDVEQQVEVKADIGDVFKGVLRQFGEGGTHPNGESMQMILEQWAGGDGSAIAATGSDTSGVTYR